MPAAAQQQDQAESARSQQSPAVALPKRLPLVTEISTRNTAFTKDSRLVNAFAERDMTDGSYQVEKRVGLSDMIYNPTQIGFPAGAGAGMSYWSNPAVNGSGQVVFVNGSMVYKIYLVGTVAALANMGSLTAGIGPAPYRFTVVPAMPTPYLVLGAGGPYGAYYTQGTTITQITDANFPDPYVPGFVYLDGTLYVMDMFGGIWGTAGLNNPIVWDPLNVIEAQSEPDAGVCLMKQLVYVVAIKQWTTQFFYDAGNATGSPLAPVPGALVNYGCVSASTVQEIDGVLFWVTQTNSGAGNPTSSSIIRLENLQPKIVSTPAIDRILISAVQAATTGSSGQWYSFAFKYSGHSYYVVTAVAANITLAYDIGQRLWYQWTDPYGNFWPIVSMSIDMFGNYLAQDDKGNIYYFGEDDIYPTDYGNIVPVDIYTPNFDGNVNRSKMLSKMYIVGDQTPGSILQLRVSEDDFQTWSNFRQFDLSAKRPYLTDCGSFERRAFHFRHQCATPFRVESVDLQMDLGTL